MFTLDITPNDFDDIAALFERLSVRMTDMTPVMEKLGRALQASTEDRFQEGVSPDGAPWAPKSQATIDAYRSREGRKKNASIDSGPLFGPSGALHETINFEAGPNSVEIGSPMIYAAVQQFGAAKGAFGTYQGKGFGGSKPTVSIPWGDIPARPFLGISDEDETGINDTLFEALDQVLKSAD